jgi:hypothetical protein
MKRSLVLALGMILALGACARYEQKPLPFRLPSEYPNAMQAYGAIIAARAIDDPEQARELFGFDILGAGLLPVQVIFDHQGGAPIEIVAGQSLLADAQGNLWNILERHAAYNRIERKTRLGEIAPEAGTGAVLGAAAGAIVGAAIGIVAGRHVGSAVGKGAVVGAAAGALYGGAKGLGDPSVGRTIGDDLRSRSLENRPIPPGGLTHGFLFFPAEAVRARQLRLQVKDTRTGGASILNFPL